MDVELAAPPAPERSRTLARVAALPARRVLAGIIALSFAVRALLATKHVAPVYLPDEYIYSALARSLAQTGRPMIRGEVVSFPALLEPILAAPLWLVGNAELTYRLTQAMHSLAMSLAAIPVYLLCRRLGLGKWFSLGSAAVAVAFPSLVYSSYITADAIAYPLALGALYAGVRALDAPTARAQLLFLGLSGLASFARLQYVVLPPLFLVAALVVERGRLRTAARTFRVALLVTLSPLVVLVALGPSRVLGYYSGIADLDLRPGVLAQSVAIHVVGLAYASGWIVVPGALVALALGLARPSGRAEAAFAALTSLVGAALVAQASLYAANGATERFKERYVIALLPLALPLFGVYLRRGAPGRVAVALLSASLLVLSARVPLSGYATQDGKWDSPFLQAVSQLLRYTSTGTGALAVALVAAVLALAAAVLALRPRLAAPIAIGCVLAVGIVGSVGVHTYHQRITSNLRVAFLPANVEWIDDAPLDDVALLVTPGSPRGLGFAQLFWNGSIDDVYRIEGTRAIDAFKTTDVGIAPDGRILADGRTVRQPLLVEQYGSTTTFSGAVRVERHERMDLWRPVGTPRVSTMAIGRYFDGWLAAAGAIRIWPDESGWSSGTLRLELSLPKGFPMTPLRVQANGIDSTLVLKPGERRTLRIPIRTRGTWTLIFKTRKPLVLDDTRWVSVQASAPVFERVPVRPAVALSDA